MSQSVFHSEKSRLGHKRTIHWAKSALNFSSFCGRTGLKLAILCRLEQLVLDDFHILVEEFTIQIKQIMQFWLDTLNDPDRPVVPSFKPQVLLDLFL